eukprot:COSAG02_NODE_5994_length_3885_cov_2.425251_4_plen_153_part_00
MSGSPRTGRGRGRTERCHRWAAGACLDQQHLSISTLITRWLQRYRLPSPICLSALVAHRSWTLLRLAADACCCDGLQGHGTASSWCAHLFTMPRPFVILPAFESHARCLPSVRFCRVHSCVQPDNCVHRRWQPGAATGEKATAKWEWELDNR